VENRLAPCELNSLYANRTNGGLGILAEVLAMVPKRQADTPRCSTCNDEMELTLLIPPFGESLRAQGFYLSEVWTLGKSYLITSSRRSPKWFCCSLCVPKTQTRMYRFTPAGYNSAAPCMSGTSNATQLFLERREAGRFRVARTWQLDGHCRRDAAGLRAEHGDAVSQKTPPRRCCG